MKIGIFLDEWADGGVPVFLKRLEGKLTNQGHHVVFFLLRPHGKRAPVARRLFEKLKATLRDRCVSLDMDSFPRHWRKSHFVKTLVGSGIECLLINQFRSSLPYLEAIAGSIPLISISHTDSDYYYHEFLLTEQMTAAHIAVSDAIYRQCAAFAAPERSHRIHSIPYGVEASDAFIPALDGPLSVIYCARLDHLQKRCRDLVPIWEKYLALGGTGRLTIIGTGQAIGYLTETLKKQVDAGQVVFCHHLPAEEVAAKMARGDVLLNISNFEGLPQTVLEGANLGLYPLLSDIESGHRQIVESLQAGTLCRIGDTSAFAHELLRLEKDLPGLRHQRSRIREWTLQHHSLEKCVLRYAAVMEGVRKIAPQISQVTAHQPSLRERAARVYLLARYRRYYPAIA